MRKDAGLLKILFVLVAFFLVLQPDFAHAQSSGNSGTSATATMCNDGTFDASAQTELNAAMQAKEKKIIDVTNQFPVISASNACIEGIITALQRLPALADPFNLANMLITSLIVSIINQACSAVTSTINGIDNLIKNTFTICLPLPNFNLNLTNNINSSACSGGTAFSLISGFSNPARTSYSTSDFLQH